MSDKPCGCEPGAYCEQCNPAQVAFDEGYRAGYQAALDRYRIQVSDMRWAWLGVEVTKEQYDAFKERWGPFGPMNPGTAG